MKQQISTPVAAAIVVVAVVGIGYLGWTFATRQERPLTDVTPMVREMNSGKPQTRTLSPEEAAGDAVLMGSDQMPKKKDNLAKPKATGQKK